MNWRVVVGLLAFVISLAALPAEARFRVCNNSSDRLNIAFGYVDRTRGWTSEGWWTLNSTQCTVVHEEDLDNRYYYVLAEPTDGGPPWKGGKVAFCVAEKSFRLYQEPYGKSTQEECAKAGLRSALFIADDVGQGQKNHTFNFGGAATAPTATAPQQQSPVAAAPPAPQPPPAAPPSPQPPVATAQPPRPQPPVATAPRPAPAQPAGTNPNGSACQRYPNLC